MENRSRKMRLSILLVTVICTFNSAAVHANLVESHEVLLNQTVKDSTQSDEVLSFADPLQENMVVQQNKPFKVWGRAPAGKKVRIYADWMPNPITVIADDNNLYVGIIPVPKAPKGDFTKHTLRIEAGESSRTIENILIGDVWFLGGQSNMQFGMDEVDNSEQEIAKADHPNMRIMSAKLNFSASPVDSIGGQWRPVSPQTINKFSAVGYYFGQKLRKDLDIPIGLIFSGIGASVAQAYVPQPTLGANALLDSVYLEPYLQSDKSKEKIDADFSFEKVTRPFLLYNAMIHPFTNLSIKGVCWYQGESNRHDRNEYTQLMYELIESWRTQFSQGNLPFYYVQVAPFYYDQEDPMLADYAYFREQQERISRLNNTEMVIIMDVGEAKNLHPTDKKPIGIRLARTALNRTYSQLDVTYRGPRFESVEFEQHTAVINFEPETVQSGLRTNDGKAPAFFMLAGKDQVFYPAEAKIKGEQIYVTSSKVDFPVAVRYAFTNYPVTNLENGAGLPAVPFRSDDWPEKREE